MHFHRTMTIHIGYQGFCGSYTFWCRIGLKIILRLARDTGEGNTKFGIFQRWFALMCIAVIELCQSTGGSYICLPSESNGPNRE